MTTSPWRSLRVRLILAYAGLIVVGFGGLAVIAGRQISAGAVADYERGFQTQASIVARALTESVEHFAEGEGNQAALEQLANAYADQINARVTLIDPMGRAWLDSTGQSPAGNLRNAPEVIAALDQTIASDVRPNENGVETLYTAAPIRHDNRVLSVVRLATPAIGARAEVAQRWLALGLGVALLTLLALGAALWLATSLTRPLEQLRASALRLAGGDLAHRLPEERGDEMGELAAAFNHMASQVQAMLDEQRAFASNVSHELRTPLTTIRLRTEALRNGRLDQVTANQYIAEIDDEMIRLSDLINDLILLSRFDAGRAEPGDEQVDPLRLAQGLTRSLAPRAAAAGVELSLDVPASLPPVEASLSHMRVVFNNLLENALKYTPAGGRITWRLWAEGDQLRAEVRDTGQGIAAEDLPHLFERFYRADKARTRAVKGVGLGLSLTHSIVAFYNGRIVVDSPGLGQGTIVQVWWPLQHSAAPPAAAA